MGYGLNVKSIFVGSDYKVLCIGNIEVILLVYVVLYEFLNRRNGVIVFVV